MKQNYCHLEWDTDFFGFRVARIVHTDLNEAELSDTLKVLRDNNYRLVYWRVPAEQYASSRIALNQGAFLADEKVTYFKDLTSSLCCPGNSKYVTDSYSGLVPDLGLLDLALQSSEYSRFRLDPLVPVGLCDKLYTCWITRSVSKEIAWEVLVVREHNNLLGLITLGAEGDCADIGLVAVAADARNKGVGRALVASANRHFLEKGYTRAQVVTQRYNASACRLYESLGYKINKIENIFHFWL